MAFGVDRTGASSGAGASDDPITEALIDAKGDLIVGASADTPLKLTVGVNGTVLVADSAAEVGVKWATPAEARTALDVPSNAEAILDSLIDAKGDLIVGTANNTPARLVAGVNGAVLAADSTAAEGVAWSVVGFTTGDVKLTIKIVADTGWVFMNDGTIGNASSAGTTRANADTAALFALLWTNTADADCAVSTGRGASAVADYAANKTIALPKALGRALATYGAGSGLTSRTLAKTAGDETHTLTTAESAAHTHLLRSYTGGGGGGYVEGSGGWVDQYSNPDQTGGGGAHNNMQPSVFLNVMVKL